jgi:hypothetical protein
MACFDRAIVYLFADVIINKNIENLTFVGFLSELVDLGALR